MDEKNELAPYEKQFDVATRKAMVAEMLRELRKAKGVQQKEIAKALDISPQTYNGYEKGRNEPPTEMLVRLSFFYGMPIDMIVQRDRMHKFGQSALDSIQSLEQQLADIRNDIGGTKFGENDQIRALITAMEQLTEISREVIEKAKI